MDAYHIIAFLIWCIAAGFGVAMINHIFGIFRDN